MYYFINNKKYMKILKKILAFAIILWMFGLTSVNSFAKTEINNDFNILESSEISEYKIKILKLKWWEKLIKKIDAFILKISDKKLKILENKIYNILENKKLSEKNVTILKYIIEKIEKKKEIIKVLENSKKIILEVLEAEQAKKDIFKSTLSESDNKKVNTQLIKIQKNILEQWVNSFEKILWELEKYTNYEEKGNFDFKLNLDHKTFWKGKVEIKLKDYISRNSNFDAQFKSKIEAIIEATPKGQKEIKMKFSAFIDYIIKDQNYYVLLKNLNITSSEQNEEIKMFIEKAKQLASKNKYIKIEDKNAEKIINQIKQFTPQNILKQGNEIVKKPLFKAYKKEWNKYYLIPSKYGCDIAKKLSKSFDPFNWNTCTESQYKDLLEDIADSKTNFYIDLSGKYTNIGFESNIDNMEELKWDISFSDKYIEEINFSAIPNQNKYPEESASFNYKRNKILNAYFYANKWVLNLNLKSTLDKNNSFSKIDFKANLSNFIAELKLYNNKITGKYDLKDWSNKIVWIISWKTNYNNIINRLKISNQIVNLWKYSPFENLTTFEYINKSIKLSNKYSSKWDKSEFNMWWEYSNWVLTSGYINIDMKGKESTFDYKTYKRIYSWDFKKVLNSNITLKNRKINGSTKIYVKDKEYFTIKHNGKLEKDFFELNNKIELKEEATKMFMKWFDPMWLDTDIKKINMNINLEVDTRWSKNNWYFYIDLNLDTDKIIEIEIDNKSTKIYKKINIYTPSDKNTIPLWEAMENETLY